MAKKISTPKKMIAVKSTLRNAAKRPSPPAATISKKLSARPFGKTVDQYVIELAGWQKQCVSTLRQLIREAAPQAIESIKWGQPVYEHNGPFAWIKAHANHVSCGFWRGAELPDPSKLLEGTGKKMRHVKFAGL